MRTPEEIVTELAPAYTEWKGGEKSKNELREEFFEAITEYLKENGEPAEDYLEVAARDSTEAQGLAEKQRPGWIVDAIRKAPRTEPDADTWEVILIEDPAFMTFTVEHDGMVWSRQVSEGDSMLDNERLVAEDPELWKRISQYPHWKLVEDVAYEAGMDPRECDMEYADTGGFDGYLERQLERHGYKRELKDFDEIDEADLAAMQGYMYVGQPKIKLPAPKKVKK